LRSNVCSINRHTSIYMFLGVDISCFDRYNMQDRKMLYTIDDIK